MEHNSVIYLDASLLICRFPKILLNEGQYHLCTWLQDQRTRDTYETLDGICALEVIRVDENQIRGCRPQVCVFYDQHASTAVNPTTSKA